MTARVSVVIPCYNDGAFLEDALASLAGQEPHELVIVDDGSDDPQTLTVLRDCETLGMRVVCQMNSGLSAARMAGVRATQARYVQPLDADDKLAPGALTRLADALDHDRDAQLAWGDIQSFGARRCHYPKAPSLDPWRITYLDEIPGTAMIRREALLEAEGWATGVIHVDWDLWMTFAERGWHGVSVPQVTLFYREHSSSRMYSSYLKKRETARAMLRQRHQHLYTARSSNRRHSHSSLGVKILFPIVDRVPGLSALERERIWVVVRHIFEPRMKPDCYPSAWQLLRSLPAKLLARRRRGQTV